MAMKLDEDWGCNQIKSTTYYDKGDDQVLLYEEQDMTAILKANHACRKAFAQDKNSDGKYGEGVKVASIPNIKVDELMRKGIWQNKSRLRQWLNDPANRMFRTIDMKV